MKMMHVFVVINPHAQPFWKKRKKTKGEDKQEELLNYNAINVEVE